jgi:CspA family cold shock protein
LDSRAHRKFIRGRCPSTNLFYLIFYTMQGIVKFFNESKGFGFITPSNSQTDIFVHTSGLIDEIQENDEVSYDEQAGRKGMNAVNVTRIMD